MNAGKPAHWQRRLRRLGIVLAWLFLACLTLWAVAALYFDLSLARLRFLSPSLYLLTLAVLVWISKRRILRMAICLAAFLFVH